MGRLNNRQQGINTFWLLLLMGLLSFPVHVYSQGGGGPGSSCTPIKVDLRGQPSGVYDTVGLVRSNTCCGNSSCVQFDVRLDPQALAFKVEITSGAAPGGSITYEINCSGNPQYPGNTICVGKNDSFSITFCKPGNNPNGYRIISKKKPELVGDSVVYDGCSGLMVADSFEESTIQWSSVTNNAFYDSMLSCTSGCDSTQINLLKGYPDSIQYQVRGIPNYQCATDTVYDTVTVYLKDSLRTRIAIQKDSQTCTGQPDTATLKTITNGGDPPYSYNWSTGSTSPSIRTDTGTYWVTVNDPDYCLPASDTFKLKTTDIMIPDIAINGKDTICGLNDTFPYWTNQIQHNTYHWEVLAKGTLTSSNGQDSAKIRWDSVGKGIIKLTQTNRAGCDTMLKDTVYIGSIPNPAIEGEDTVCAYTNNHPYETEEKPGHDYSWSINNGIIQAGANNDQTEVKWLKHGIGTLNITQNNPIGCQAKDQKVVTIKARPNPLINFN